MEKTIPLTPTYRLKNASLHRNREMRCLNRPQHRHLQFLLVLCGYKQEMISLIYMTIIYHEIANYSANELLCNRVTLVHMVKKKH